MSAAKTTTQKTVHTATRDWLETVLRYYVNRQSFTLVDDGGIGVTMEDLESALSLLKAGWKRGDFTVRQIVTALTGLGITGLGLWMIAGALGDPEPTSKLELLVLGGVVLSVTGSLATLHALGVPVVVRMNTRDEFQIDARGNNGGERRC